MKILIIRFSSIGDIILTTPVPRVLKAQLDNVEIHYATKEQYKIILENNPYIDKLFLLRNRLTDLISQLQSENYDYVIDLHHNLRTRILKWRLGVKFYHFQKLNFKKWLLVNFKINKMPSLHIVDRYLETVSPLGVKNDSLGLDYFIPAQDVVPLEWLPHTHQKGYVAYAIGAQHNTKKLPLKKMIELCNQINFPIVLLGGKEDVNIGEKIKTFYESPALSIEYENGLRELGKATRIYNACGLYNLNQSASILKRAQYVFTHDTGLMHIAAALKKQIFSIWGNTVPAFGMYPYRTKFTVIERTGLSCRPCSKIGFNQCPKKHFKCMNDISFDFHLRNILDI